MKAHQNGLSPDTWNGSHQLKYLVCKTVNIQSEQIVGRLQELGDPEVAAHSQRFFKTGKGEYGEGDKFLGIRVPVLRKCVREFRHA